MNKIKFWLGNARSIALPQSLMPAILAAVLAIGDNWSILNAILAVIGVGCAHLAMNLTDDYFDYLVNMKGDRDAVQRKGFRAMTVKYPFLTDGSATLSDTRKAIATFIAIALACGIVIYCRYPNPWIPAIVAAAGFLGVFYSGKPLKLAYRGLGELVIGIIFGPLTMMGVYCAACGRIDPEIVFISIPVGMLVMEIVYVHSILDMPADTEGGKMTFARLLKTPAANLVCSYFIILVPFLLICTGVILGMLHPAYLAVALMLPRAIWQLWSIGKFTRGEEIDTRERWYLGKFPNWEATRQAGLDWFMIRWLTARNLLSGFCTVIIIVKIVLLCLS